MRGTTIDDTGSRYKAVEKPFERILAAYFLAPASRSRGRRAAFPRRAKPVEPPNLLRRDSAAGALCAPGTPHAVEWSKFTIRIKLYAVAMK